MLRSRLLEQKMITLQRHGKLSTYAGSSGQEALYVAIGNALDKNDIHVPYYRDQPCMLMRGYEPLDIMRYWGGNELGNTACQHNLPFCVPIATQCLHATGIAYALKYKSSRSIVLVTLGDGATSKGDFYEALNFSSLHNLPIVFVINDNGWAISTPLSKQTKVNNLAKKAMAFDMESDSFDATNLTLSVNKLIDACNHARTKGPILVHAKTIRLCDHTTADDAKRYKPNIILHEEASQDPITKFKKKLETHYDWSKQDEISLINTLNYTLSKDVEKFEKETIRPPAEMLDHCYENIPSALKKQQKELLS